MKCPQPRASPARLDTVTLYPNSLGAGVMAVAIPSNQIDGPVVGSPHFVAACDAHNGT